MPPPCSITRRSYPGEVGPGAIHPSPPRGTEGSNPTLGSFGRSKNARDSAILGDQINEFCPRFCPRRKAIKDPGWCGLDAPGQQFIHRPRTWRYPRLHPACSQAARQGRARAPQSTMTKVGKSHSKGTFAGAFGSDEDAPRPAILRVANNEEYGIIGRNPGVENGARSRRGSGLRLRIPHAARSVRARRSTPSALNRSQARSADSLAWDACSRYRIDAEAAQSGRGSDPGRGLATADVRCN